MFKKRWLTKLFAFVFAFAIVFAGISGNVDAKKQKTSSKGSSKRSASSKKNAKSGSKRSASSKKNAKGSSKRSASSKNGRRAASTNSRRAASTNARRASATAGNARRASALATVAGNAQNVAKTTTENTATGNPCPVGKVIKFSAEDDKYYSARSKICDVPQNAHEEAWTSSSKLKRLAWIDASEAVYFECDEGFMLSKGACVDAFKTCPIGVPVEKKDGGYINPNTDEACTAPVGSSTKKISGKEAEEWGIETGFLFSCKENFYAEEVKGTEGYLALCTACPEGKKSQAGSVGDKACKEAKFFCEVGTAYDDTAKSCQPCKEGEFSLGAGDECKSCLTDGVATCENTTGKVLTCKAPYELKDGKCTNVCQAGTALVGEECKPCGEGTYALDGATECLACIDSTSCDSKTGKATSCKPGSKLENGVCSMCPQNTYSAGGTATTCTACQSGYESASGATSCTKSAALIQEEKEKAEYEERQKALKNKYLNPQTKINRTFSGANMSGSVGLGVGCYRIIASGAGGGSNGSYAWIWNHWGTAGGDGGRATAYFCVNSGTATVEYYTGRGGYNAHYNNCGGAGQTTWFRVNGDLDYKFSGINSGNTIYVYGGAGGCGVRSNSSYKAGNGGVSGIASCSNARYLPSEYRYEKTGFGLSSSIFRLFGSCYGALSGTCVGTGCGGTGGGAVQSYYGVDGQNGSIQIDTIVPKVPLY